MATTRKRRSQGEGSVCQRKDGRWCGRIYLGEEATGEFEPFTGAEGQTLFVPVTRTLVKSVYGKTKGEVLEKLRAEQTRKKSGLKPTVERWTVAQLMAEWLESVDRSVRLGKLRPTTAASYVSVAKSVIAAIGKKRVEGLTTAEVEKMLLALQVRATRPKDMKLVEFRPASDAYRRRAKVCLSSALDDAVNAGRLPRNVAATARVQAIDPSHEGRTLTTEQARLLLAHVKGHPLELFVVAGLMLGLRGGETCALRWSDVDLKAGTLRITGSLARTKDGLVRFAPKTERSRDVLDLPAPMLEALQRARKARSVASLHGNDYILTMATGPRIGEPVERNYASRWLGRIAVEAGVLEGTDEPLRGHELRHCAASLLYSEGLPLEEISRLLRHTSLSITERIYRHRVPGQRSAASVAADALFGG